MTDPKDLKRLLEFMESPEKIVKTLPDEQFRLITYAVAQLFSTLKVEGIKRGIWNDMKTKKVETK
jgi:hypothetical protein